MIFMGRKRAAAPGGTVGPLVSFDGANDYVTGIAGLGATPTLTVAGRVVWDGDPGTLSTVLAFDAAAMRIVDSINPRQIQLELIDGAFGTIVDAQYTHTWADNEVMAFVLAVDVAAGLAGGKSVSLYINGAERISSTTTGANLELNFGGAPGFSLMGLDDGTRLVTGETNGLWVSQSAVDPQSHYSSFFNGSDQWQGLSTAGTINGVTPDFWQNGNVAAWNSGSDNNSVAYTMNGAVT